MNRKTLMKNKKKNFNKILCTRCKNIVNEEEGNFKMGAGG